jgi:hypothetical protein
MPSIVRPAAIFSFANWNKAHLLSSPAEPSLQPQNFLAMGCDRFGIGVWGMAGGGFENLNAIFERTRR